METDLGKFVTDASGLAHYVRTSTGVVDMAVRDALKHRPDGPAWFWFMSTPAPIQPNDEESDLLARWGKWRSSFQRNPESILELLEEYSKTAV